MFLTKNKQSKRHKRKKNIAKNKRIKRAQRKYVESAPRVKLRKAEEKARKMAKVRELYGTLPHKTINNNKAVRKSFIQRVKDKITGGDK